MRKSYLLSKIKRTGFKGYGFFFWYRAFDQKYLAIQQQILFTCLFRTFSNNETEITSLNFRLELKIRNNKIHIID